MLDLDMVSQNPSCVPPQLPTWKLSRATATHNYKWVKIFKYTQSYDNRANVLIILFPIIFLLEGQIKRLKKAIEETGA